LIWRVFGILYCGRFDVKPRFVIRLVGAPASLVAVPRSAGRLGTVQSAQATKSLADKATWAQLPSYLPLMILSDFERETGMREFRLRERYRILVFTGPTGWVIHNTDPKGRSIDSYPLLSFSDIEDRLSDLPNALAEARLLEEERLAAKTNA
jgi:hypothetical protein